MLKTQKLPSGTDLGLYMASWAAASELRWCVADQLMKVEKKLSGPLLDAALSKDVTRIIAAVGSEDIDAFANLFLMLLRSRELEACVFACMEKCTLQPAGEAIQKIVANTFEPEARREDFYPAAVEVIRLNLRPFMKGLVSMLKSAMPDLPPVSPK